MNKCVRHSIDIQSRGCPFSACWSCDSFSTRSSAQRHFRKGLKDARVARIASPINPPSRLSASCSMLAEVSVSSIQLPYDLERSIIEFSAGLDQSMAVKLSLVSREVKRWYLPGWCLRVKYDLPLPSRVDPILYRTLKFQSSSQADDFIRTLDEGQPKRSASITSTVKSVSFTYGVTLHQAAKILSTCTNITRLASWIECSQGTLDISLDDIFDFGRFITARSPMLRRLSVTLRPSYFYPQPSFHLPLFQNLTHLSIFGAADHCYKWSWRALDTLLHLTHLAIELDTPANLQTVYNVLPRFPESLRACLVIFTAGNGKPDFGQYINDSSEVQEMIMGNTDTRIVVGITEQLDCLLPWSHQLVVVQLWDDACEDEEAWTKVEGIIDSRRHGGRGTCRKEYLCFSVLIDCMLDIRQ